jgi:ketosteroid isomerase-like protein
MTRLFLFAFLVLVILSACQTSEEEKIYQTLRQREEAFQKKDLSLYLSCISSDYQDKNEDFNRLKERIEGYFKTFDRIDYRSWDRSVNVTGENAEVVQQIRMEVERGEKRNQYSGTELLFLKKERGKWKIAKGL